MNDLLLGVGPGVDGGESLVVGAERGESAQGVVQEDAVIEFVAAPAEKETFGEGEGGDELDVKREEVLVASLAEKIYALVLGAHIKLCVRRTTDRERITSKKRGTAPSFSLVWRSARSSSTALLC